MSLLPPAQRLANSESILVAHGPGARCELILRAIETADLIVNIVHDGATALMQVLDHEFSAILLTARLPGLDGISLLREVRMKKAVPCLFLADSYEDCVRGLDAGADDFLMSPFAATELLTRVLRVLEKPARTVRLEVNRRETQVHRQIFPAPSTAEAEWFREPGFTACWPTLPDRATPEPGSIRKVRVSLSLWDRGLH